MNVTLWVASPWLVLGPLSFVSWGELLFAAFVAVPLVFFVSCALYLLWLLANAFVLRGRVARLSPPSEAAVPRYSGGVAADAPRFAVLIPAHNEELLMGPVLDALQGMDYPPERWRRVVIADNCTDRTAEIARKRGAIVLERFNDVLIGKGYALEEALNRLLYRDSARDWRADGTNGEGNASHNRAAGQAIPLDSTEADLSGMGGFDAVVVLDADTLTDPNLLREFASGLARGEQAMQARYEVLNAGETWRTRLMSCALALAHVVKPLGRERLKLSDGLKGNGMCFARSVVEAVPWSGESITEDIEYALRLCRAGYRIAFLPGATVWAQMPTSGAQAASQRKRWEGGRYQLLFRTAPALVAESLRARNRFLFDRAVELIIPPFAEMFAVPLLLLVLCAGACAAFMWPWAGGLTRAWALVLAMQAAYLMGGMAVARVPLSSTLSLVAAPFYIVWKFGVYAAMAINRSAGGWKRTERREL